MWLICFEHSHIPSFKEIHQPLLFSIFLVAYYLLHFTAINYTCKTVKISIIKWRKYGTIWTFPGTGSQRLHASVGEVTGQFHVKVFQKSKAYVQIMYTRGFPTIAQIWSTCVEYWQMLSAAEHEKVLPQRFSLRCVSSSLKGSFLERQFFLHVIPFLMFSVRCTHLMGMRGKLQPSSTWTFTSELMDGESGWIAPTRRQSKTKQNATFFLAFSKWCLSV